MYSLTVATELHEISGNGGMTAIQRWAEFRHIPLATSKAQNANENCLPANKRQKLQMAIWQIP